MEKNLLGIIMWLMFLGGVFGLAMGMMKFFGGGAPQEYGIMGIGGGFYLLSAAIVIHIKNRA